MSDQPTTTLLILGASGDLTSRLLLPGLGTLLRVEPERRVRVVGADRARADAGGVARQDARQRWPARRCRTSAPRRW